MRKLLLFAFLLFYFWDVNAQQCGFVEPQNYQTYENVVNGILPNSSTANNESYCINVCFRILRDNNGSNAALNPALIPSILAQMNLRFNPHGITFNQVGTYDYINNTSYNNYTFPTITNPVNIPNCLNIYFIKDFSTLGSTMEGIASFGTLRATIKNTANLIGNTAHEIGHAFNLLHTYTNYCPYSATYTESPYETNINTNNCLIKGDKICDTPADYNPLYFLASSPCVPPFPLADYHPDKSNIMSYWSSKTSFTTGQGKRMRDAIASSVLQSIRSNQCFEIVGPKMLCAIKNGIYSITGAALTTSPTYKWTVTGNLQINGSSTNQYVQVSRTQYSNLFSPPSTISVKLNGTTTKTKQITTRCSMWQIIGKYDWVSTNYGNMGLIVPIDLEEEDPTTSYIWEIKEDANSSTTGNEGCKPYFVGGNTNDPFNFSSSSNQAIINWGSCSKSYLLTCKGTTQSGEQFLISESYVDVGDPKNNPCFKNAITTTIAPNPIQNGIINVVLNKPSQNSPCNYKDLSEPQYFNSEIDEINNSVSIFDYNGTEVYRKVFETNEFVIDDANLQSGNNYIVNLYTKEGGFTQKVIIVN